MLKEFKFRSKTLKSHFWNVLLIIYLIKNNTFFEPPNVVSLLKSLYNLSDPYLTTLIKVSS